MTTPTQEEIRWHWLSEAAKSEPSAEALYEVAKMYDTGAFGMKADFQRALEFYHAVGGVRVWFVRVCSYLSNDTRSMSRMKRRG